MTGDYDGLLEFAQLTGRLPAEVAGEAIAVYVGEYSEGLPWEYCRNYVARYGPLYHVYKCGHAIDTGKTQFDGDSVECVIPRAIVCYNEGGCNRTVLCLDCVLDQFGAK